MTRTSTVQITLLSTVKWLTALTLFASLLAIAGCGSTKVINSQKTLAYRGSIYNVTNVLVFSSRTEAVISESETINLAGINKSDFTKSSETHNGLFVRQLLTLDQQEVIYQAKKIDSWSDYNKMNKQFTSAVQSLQKFLANPKQTQLALK